MTAMTSAWTWITAMLGSGPTMGVAAGISPLDVYATDWTGAVAGTFTLGSLAPPAVQNPSPIVVDTPSTLPFDYSGVVTGNITLTAQADRWIIQVYRLIDHQFNQFSQQVIVDASNDFSFSLTAPSPSDGGCWALGVLDAENSYALTGDIWTGVGIYEELQIYSYSTTDQTYLVDTQSASADGTFYFSSSALGVKSFQLIDTTSGALIAEYAPSVGLVRSYLLPNTASGYGLTFTYDQSLALLAAISLQDDDTAATLCQGLVQLQTTSGTQNGGFLNSAPQFNPGGALLQYFTGVHTIATYALLRYIATLNEEAPTLSALTAVATQAITWLMAQQSTTEEIAGLFTGGWGQIDPVTGLFDPDLQITWVSTEHNLDTWHTLFIAGNILQRSDLSEAADDLSDDIVSLLWDTGTEGFYMGYTPTEPNTSPALDINSWGAIFLTAIGETTTAAASLANVSVFALTDNGVAGYGPVPTGTATDTVFLEGSLGVALAYLRAENETAYTDILTAIGSAQLGDGSFPYATTAVPSESMSTASAIASTAWFILATQAASTVSIWDETTA